jgi:hypothetical protein
MNKRHTIERISTLILLLLSILVLVGFIPAGSRFVRDIAENALRGMGADSVSVGSVSIVLWTGLRIEDIATYKRISDKGDSYRASAGSADIGCNLVSAAVMLAFNPDILKPSGRDVFREAYEKPFELLGDISHAASSLRPVKKITLRSAGIEFTGKGKPGVSVSGAEVALRRGAGMALSGSVSVRETVVPALAKVENFNARISIDGDRLELADGGGAVFGGKLRMNISIDARQSKVLGGEASVSGLDLGKFCVGTGFSPGSLAGKVAIKASLESGFPAHLDSAKAKGSVKVTNLSAADLALQKVPIVSQLSRDLRLLRFSEVKGGFTVAGGRLHFKEIAGIGDVLKFRSAGWVGFDGRISQDFEGELSAGFVAGLSRLVRGSLEKTENEGGRFKCKIGGTFHKPKIELDRSVYDRAIGGVFKGLFK